MILADVFDEADLGEKTMLKIDRITSNPNIMNGKACIRGMRVTVSLVLSLLANGMNKAEILNEYPYLEAEDVDQCLNYAALLAQSSLFTI
jgi:uncharacterized protein (DUF433 family)